MTLSDELSAAIAPLTDVLPIDSAMGALVVREGATVEQIAAVEEVLKHPLIAANENLQGGLWLYVDELDRSHDISQGIHDATGSFWHGIMHRREGDFGNSHYWFNKVGHHPAMDAIPGYDGPGFIDDVAARHTSAPEDLIEMQRKEWQTLFTWCANR